MLIQLNEDEIVNSSYILWAKRNGNYTDVKLKNSSIFIQILDANKDVWNQIEKASEK
jgi:hypothetical protein